MTIPSLLFGIMLGAAATGGTGPVPNAPRPDPVAQAESAIARNLQSESGRKYADTAAKAASGTLEAALRACRDSLNGPHAAAGSQADTSAMDVYVMLNRRGMPKSLLVRPQGKTEQCLIARVGGRLSLPAPPDGNYWVKLRASPAAEGPAAGRP